MEEFDDGASLKFTVGKRYAPNGSNIDTTGIAPDVVIEFDADAYLENTTDNQLEKSKEVLNNMMK
jgi:carboxyl-terminal processing protease